MSDTRGTLPRHPLLEHIQTADDFKRLLNTICHDLGRILDKWSLFQNLREAQQGPFTKALSQSQSFWSVVLGSLQDAVLFGLCRAYDDHRDALTLRTVIETLRLADDPAQVNNVPQFLKGLPSVPREQLDADLNSVNRRRTSQSVKHLLMWRDKFYAHRDPEKIKAGRTLGEQYPITYRDVDALLENGFSIVNRYSATIFRASNSRSMSGADDYLNLLRTVQEHVEGYEAKWRGELRRAQEQLVAPPSTE